MNVTEDDLRNNYEGMESDELVKLLAQGTLTNQAKYILEEILNGRNVSADYIQETAKVVIEEKRKEEEFFDLLASRGVRLYAKAIDIAFASIPLFISVAVDNNQLFGFSVLFFILYIAFGDGINGQSIGKRIANIIVVKENTMKPCTLGISALRNSLLFLITKIDLLFMVRQTKKRLGDSLAGTLVVKTKPGSDHNFS